MLACDNPPSPKRRIDRLAELIAYILTRTRLQALVCFHERPIEIPLTGHLKLPEPEASTALHLALLHVCRLDPRPQRVIVVTDGAPNSEEHAIRAAQQLQPMPIDVYYCGEEGDPAALGFIERLARVGGGKWGHFELNEPKLLGEEIRLQITQRRG